MQETFLVVADEQALRDAVAEHLRKEGDVVLAVADGTLALEAAQGTPLALVILDLMLAQSGALALCRSLRACPETETVPILLMITDEAQIGQLERLGLRVNDYIKKPLHWEELRACVLTLLHRGRRDVSRKLLKALPRKKIVRTEDRVLTAGDLHIDIARRRVIRGNRLIDLPQVRLFDLLVYLVEHRGVVLTRERMLARVWGYEQMPLPATRTVDVHVRWLREKIEEDPANPKLIQTVRGVGYCFGW